MTVTVQDTAGNPITGAIVVLDANAQQKTTNAQGKATFSATGAHDLHVFKDGYAYLSVLQVNTASITLHLAGAPGVGGSAPGVYVAVSVPGGKSFYRVVGTFGAAQVSGRLTRNPVSGNYEGCVQTPGATIGGTLGGSGATIYLVDIYATASAAGGLSYSTNGSNALTVPATATVTNCASLPIPLPTPVNLGAASFPATPTPNVQLTIQAVTPPPGVTLNSIGIVPVATGAGGFWYGYGTALALPLTAQFYDWSGATSFRVTAMDPYGNWVLTKAFANNAAVSLTSTLSQAPAVNGTASCTAQTCTITITPATGTGVKAQSVQIMRAGGGQPFWVVLAPNGASTATLPRLPATLAAPLLKTGKSYDLQPIALAVPGAANYVQAVTQLTQTEGLTIDMEMYKGAPAKNALTY